MNPAKEFLLESWNKIRYMKPIMRKMLILMQLVLTPAIVLNIAYFTRLTLVQSIIVGIVVPTLIIWISVIAVKWMKDARN